MGSTSGWTMSGPRRNVVVRRRQCKSCGQFFRTVERSVPGVAWGYLAADQSPDGRGPEKHGEGQKDAEGLSARSWGVPSSGVHTCT